MPHTKKQMTKKLEEVDKKKESEGEGDSDSEESSLLLKLLSDEILLYIAGHLDIRSLESFKATCRRLYFVANIKRLKCFL